VCGSLPLLVNVLVALTADFRVREKVRGNDSAYVGLGGRGKERRTWPAPLLLHRCGDVERIVNAIRRSREQPMMAGRNRRKNHQQSETRCKGTLKMLVATGAPGERD